MSLAEAVVAVLALLLLANSCLLMQAHDELDALRAKLVEREPGDTPPETLRH